MITKVRYEVDNGGHSRAAQYALRTLLEMVVSPDSLVQGTAVAERQEDEVLVAYGVTLGATDNGVYIFVSGFFGDGYGKLDAMPTCPVIRVEGIPALYGDDQRPAGRFYSVQGGAQGARVDCHVDVVASAFFMLSRYEETVVPAVDAFDRFPAESSVAYREGFLQEAVVNQYADQLLKMLRIAGFAGERRTWWGTAPWAIALTHDVDQLHRFPRNRPPVHAVVRAMTCSALPGEPGLYALVRDYVQTLSRRKTDEYDCLMEMAAWEVSIGARSAYYFLADNTSRQGADYAVDTPDVVAAMKTMASMGHEIGFHAGFSACADAQRFHSELSRVRSAGPPIAGGRQHYLRWQTPATWRLWEAEGLAYDATLGYSSAAGFRCGTCLPFHPYDIENDREMSISEWPLMFMDATYLASWSEGTQVLDRVSQECQRYGGVLVLLWHNRYWSNLYAPLVREYFQELLERSVAQGVIVNSINGLTRLSDTALADQTRHGID
jgi:hypothetical protein